MAFLAFHVWRDLVHVARTDRLQNFTGGYG